MICRIIALSIGIFFLAPLASAEESVAKLSRVQGMVVVYGNGGMQRALTGMSLKRGDEVRTGRSGKAYIDFPDNSRVKLGSRSEMTIRKVASNQGLFTSTLDLFKGAFRYTAGKLSTWRARKTKVYTRTAVIGVRGTDFWGRSENDNTFFLLLDGEVELTPRFGSPSLYTEAGKAVNIDGSAISEPKALSGDVIGNLAAETEIN